MKPAAFAYAKARSLEDAIALLGEHNGEAKLHSSLAHLYGRPRVFLEAFHSSGWGTTLDDTLQWLLPWLQQGSAKHDCRHSATQSPSRRGRSPNENHTRLSP